MLPLAHIIVMIVALIGLVVITIPLVVHPQHHEGIRVPADRQSLRSILETR